MKKKKSPTITTDEWLEAMLPMYKRNPPEGSFTIAQVMEKTSLTRDAARSRLLELIRKGELKKERYIVNGRVVDYYIIINK